jgi:hypothetical protein
MSDVTDQLDQLAAGQVQLDAVARTSPAVSGRRGAPATGDPFEVEDQDPEPDPEGSFSEVAGYYAMGKLDDDQYAALARPPPER